MNVDRMVSHNTFYSVQGLAGIIVNVGSAMPRQCINNVRKVLEELSCVETGVRQVHVPRKDRDQSLEQRVRKYSQLHTFHGPILGLRASCVEPRQERTQTAAAESPEELVGSSGQASDYAA